MPEAPRRRLLLSALTNWLAFAATLLVSFFLAPYMIRRLGDGPYGVWVLVESILAYFTLFDLGIAAGVVRFTARFHAQRDEPGLNRLASSCLALFLGLGAIVFVLGGVLTPAFIPVMLKSGLSSSEVTAFLLLMLCNLAMSLPLSIFPSLLDGVERFAAKSAVRIAFLALRTTAIVILMEHSPSLIGVAIIWTIGNLLEHAVLVLLAFRYLPGLRFARRLISRETLMLVKGYSLDAFLAMLAGRVSVQSGAIIIGLFLEAPQITFFAVALRLVEFAKALLRSATNTLTPAISSLEAAGDTAAIRRILLNGTRWVLYLILPVHLGLVIFGAPFLTIWIGPEYAERCYPALVILSATLSLAMAQSIASRVLYGIGKLRLFARMTLLEAISNVALSVLLVGSLGIEGVALACAVPNFAMCVFAIAYACRLLGVSRATYMSYWLKPLAVAIIPAALWLSLPLPLRGWLDFAAALLIGLAPYAAAVVIAEGRGRVLLKHIQATAYSVYWRKSGGWKPMTM